MNILPDNFDDILFKNRNKSYGAFLLRKNYRKRMFISILISVFIFILIFLIPYFVINRPEKIHKESLYFSEYLSTLNQDMIKPNEELLPELKKLQKKASFTAPVISTNEDDQELSDPNSEKSDTTTNANSNNGSSNGVLGGEGDNDNAIYTYVQEQPSYPGGDEARKNFIQRNMVYPKLAKSNKIQGVVYASFIVEKNGVLTNLKILKGIGAGCDEEALRVIKLMPKWKPGKRQGVEVRVQIIMPIKFTLTKIVN